MNIKKYKYRFSVVMPIYKVEDYLEEALESVINQTIDFRKYAQIVLVNDGSPDNSEAICKKYVERYPENIVYIKKENGGVSSARNLGLEHAEGQYINFMDPDDKYAPDVFFHIDRFFNENIDIQMAAMPLQFFDAATGGHMLNAKFDRERIVDIDVDYKDIVLGTISIFIHREAIAETRYVVGKKFAEDVVFTTEVLMRIRKYGLVPQAKYLYRKRNDGSSAINGAANNVEYYIHHLRDYVNMFEQYRDKETGRYPLYLQSVVAYNLQWTVGFKEYPEALVAHKEEFLDLVYKLTSELDSEIVYDLEFRNLHQKCALIGIGQGCEKLELGNIKKHGNSLFFMDAVGNEVASNTDTTVTITTFEFDGEMVRITGYDSGSFFGNNETQFVLKTSNGFDVHADKLECPMFDVYLLGKKIHQFNGFQVAINKDEILKSKNFSIYTIIGGVESKAQLEFKQKFSKIVQKLGQSYTVVENKAIKYSKQPREFVVQSNSIRNIIVSEIRNLKGIRETKKKDAEKILVSRMYIRLWKKFSSKKINVFMDRVEKANDNAEVLYSYFEERKTKNEENYFVISKKSPDFVRLKSKGFNLVPYGSLEHRFILLKANNFISSSGDVAAFYPFDKKSAFFNDLMDYNYVFLQHGILQGDLSDWINKSTKNFRIFLTSTWDEYNGVVGGDYQFTEREVKLTGLPRFDGLSSDENPKNVLIMPSWRYDTVSEFDKRMQKRPYNDKFKESDYFAHWNGILSNEQFLDCAKQHGYNIVFVPHPCIRQQLKDFDLEGVEVASETELYSDIFKKGALLLTDYSSVHCDFSYMEKPVIYYQFDKGNINYVFQYEGKGFGPVLETSEEVVSQLIEDMKNGCEMKSKYIDRVNDFFVYNDKNNCARVYEEVQKL